MVASLTDTQGSSDTGFWGGRSVLVTGATGFIGGHLSRELLDRGAVVTALIRNDKAGSFLALSGLMDRINVVNGSVEAAGVVERAIVNHEVEIVFHLAAQALVGAARRAPALTLETNIRGTYLLLEACRQQRAQLSGVIVASSDKAYGQHRELPYHEDVALRGEFPYDVSKSCADLIAQSYSISYDLPVGIARCGNVYGGGDLNWSRLVPGTIRSGLAGDPPLIRSDGSYLRDYIYVSDVVGGYLLLAEEVAAGRAPSRVYNFGNEEPVRVVDLVATILRMMDLNELKPEVVNTAEGEIHSQFLSAERAGDELGWRPTYDLRRGLELTIDWYRDFLER